MDFSPKSNFAKGPTAAAWTDVASSSLFREAASVAMLQMQANLGMATSNEAAAAYHFKMEGARQLLAIMMNLTTPPEAPPKRMTSDNLRHDV